MKPPLSVTVMEACHGHDHVGQKDLVDIFMPSSAQAALVWTQTKGLATLLYLRHLAELEGSRTDPSLSQPCPLGVHLLLINQFHFLG